MIAVVEEEVHVLTDEKRLSSDDDESLVTVGDLCRLFEESEEASMQAREDAERDRDYYDNKQLTDAQMAELSKRGQPAVVINRIKRKIDYLVGLEKQQRTMPRSLPRTPAHEQDAHAVTDALRFVAESEDYASKRSAAWRNMLIEGAACLGVSVEPKPSPDPFGMPMFDVKIKHYTWDRFFADPHSCRLDYSDATYLGVVLWMDRNDAVAKYGPEAEEIIESTIQAGTYGDTYEDTPKHAVWADRKRRRVRIVQMWLKRDNEWYFAEFTKGGILKAGPSPYVDDEGRTQCELVAQAAYRDRENNSYGVVREMVSPQDEINKRRSKALHILNTAQVIAEEGAVQDESEAKRQALRPDGWIRLNPNMADKFRFETRTDMANGQLGLLQEAKAEIDLMGPNASMQGSTGETASGRAIMASQQGGMIQMGDLLDSLRHLDRRIFRLIWSRIRQFWTGPMWVRITDDERNVRFAPLNGEIDPTTGRPGPQLAALDADIIIDDAPDSVAPAIEQFQALVEIKKMDTGNDIPFRAIVEAMPNLRNKEKFLEQIDKRTQEMGSQPNPEMLAMQAKMQMAEQEAQARLAERQQQAEIEMAIEQQRAALEAQRMRERAMVEIEIARMKAQSDIEIAQMKAQAEVLIRAQTAQMVPAYAQMPS